MTSSNYANLKVVNWDFVKKISVRDLRLDRDPKIIRKLIINFLNSSSLFADPSFCPPDLVSKYFQLLQISVLAMVNHIDSLNQAIEEKNIEIQKLKNERKKEKSKTPKYILPPVVFQCTFCSKMFKTRSFLNKHLLRRHPDKNYQVPRDLLPYDEPKTDHIVRTVTNVPELSQDLGPFKAEVNAMVDHFDTILRSQQTSIRTDFMEQIHKIEHLVQETLRKIQEEKFNSMQRGKGSTDASYSDLEVMHERIQPGDDSSDTHTYVQNDNENEQGFSSEETYYNEYSLEDGEMKKNTKSTNQISAENNTSTNVTPTTTTTIKNGSPILPQPVQPQTSITASTTTTTNYTQDSQYYTYSDYDYDDYD